MMMMICLSLMKKQLIILLLLLRHQLQYLQNLRSIWQTLLMKVVSVWHNSNTMNSLETSTRLKHLLRWRVIISSLKWLHLIMLLRVEVSPNNSNMGNLQLSKSCFQVSSTPNLDSLLPIYLLKRQLVEVLHLLRSNSNCRAITCLGHSSDLQLVKAVHMWWAVGMVKLQVQGRSSLQNSKPFWCSSFRKSSSNSNLPSNSNSLSRKWC